METKIRAAVGQDSTGRWTRVQMEEVDIRDMVSPIIGAHGIVCSMEVTMPSGRRMDIIIRHEENGEESISMYSPSTEMEIMSSGHICDIDIGCA